MTEAEWLACDDPGPMLGYVRGIVGSRKLRLFACACDRGSGDSSSPEALVEVAEAVADGAPASRLTQARKVGDANRTVVQRSARDAAETFARYTADEKYRSPRAALLRDIVGNPFRRPTVDRFWLSGTVLRLAQAAYEDRFLPSGHLDPARLAVLSDAQEEVGCTDAEVLAHLRSAGPHVRGCRAVDLLLGRS
jgi:hypothetical protein